MTRRSRLMLALLTAAFCFAPAAAVRADEDTELAKQMEVIEKGMKKLKKSLKSADENAASIATVAEIKKAAVASKDLIPALAAKKPEGERAAFTAAYKKDMEAFIADVDKLDEALKANKNEEALAVLKKLGEAEDKGHEKYTE